MAKKICKCCGKEFEGYGTAKYCKGPHYFKCEVCGEMFESDPRNPSRACSSECRKKLCDMSKQTTKICEYCGKEFIARQASAKYCSGPHYTECVICGKIIEFTCLPIDKPNTCSQKCANELKRRTVCAKYGVINVSELESVRSKISESNSSEAVMAKRHQTCLERWGVENVSQNPEIRSKLSEIMSGEDYLHRREQTCLRRYGHKSPMQSDEVKAKVISSNQSKYGVNWATQSKLWKDKKMKTNLERYGVPHYCMTDECKAKNGHTISQTNINFMNRLKDIGIFCDVEFRIENKSYDLRVARTNILIEINPTYTHNSFGNHWDTNGLDKNYHIEKTEVASRNGFRCIHVWDWDDIHKIVNMLQPKKVKYARQFNVVELKHDKVSKFLKDNHLQGDCKGQSTCIGLVGEDENIVQVMTFGKPRYTSKYQYELLRLCTDSRYRVVGGAQRLFKYFVQNFNPDSILSYCDMSKFSGEVYERLGMVHHHNTEPAKVWSNGSDRITDNLLRQRGVDQLFHTDFGKGSSNEELMIEMGWLPVYDCGQSVYVFINKEEKIDDR